LHWSVSVPAAPPWAKTVDEKISPTRAKRLFLKIRVVFMITLPVVNSFIIIHAVTHAVIQNNTFDLGRRNPIKNPL
jgi:hypothetical protein